MDRRLQKIVDSAVDSVSAAIDALNERINELEEENSALQNNIVTLEAELFKELDRYGEKDPV
ncbi:MAG: hypothetical protein IPJ51_10520 [Saprospiraceae bacterium]|nr:hypothetical protein [Saprospiraceae bacterium]